MRRGPLRDDWGGLLFTAGMSIARLFGTGGHHHVLRTLDGWLHDPRVSLRKLAVQAVVLMVKFPVSGLGRPDHDGADDLALRGELTRAATAGLRSSRCRTAILTSSRRRGPRARRPAHPVARGGREGPRPMVRPRHQRCRGAGRGGVVPVPARRRRVRPLPRLRGLVRRERRTWADPLPADVADRLDDALARATAAPSRGRMAFT